MNTVKHSRLSVIIHVADAEKTLERTLRSVQFADEIVVIDMHSADGSLAIAKRFTKAIYRFPKKVTYVEPARNFGIAKAKNPWVLLVDADEEVSPDLQKAVKEALQDPIADVYFLPRKNLVFGQWIQRTGWWPDFIPRLFQKGALSWPEELHAVPEITGSQYFFPAEEQYALVHHNYEDVGQFLERLNHYTSIQASERAKALPVGQFSPATLLEVFANEFASRALAKNGIQDGLHGTSLALLQGMYEATVYLKQWGHAGYPPQETKNFGKTLNTVMKIWRYWWADYQVRHTTGLGQLYWRVRRKWQV